MLQLLWYGFGNQPWMMWAAGILAALASITYPAISAFVSIHSTADRQGERKGERGKRKKIWRDFIVSVDSLRCRCRPRNGDGHAGTV